MFYILQMVNLLAIPSQDMVLGCYYLTRPKVGDKGEGKIFGSLNEILMAYENKAVGLHAIIDVRHKGKWHKKTTVGRAILNSIIPEELDYFDELISKKTLSKIVNQSYLIAGNYKTVEFLDNLKELGFNTATRSGSLNIN